MKKVRLKDIAKLAHVSEASVSLVLNDAPSRISEDKKTEIKRIAEELNYRPNYVARSLSTNKTQTIGLIIPDIENPYFSSFSKHVEDLLRKEGYLVFMVNSDDHVENDRTLIKELKDRQVDGLILCPALDAYRVNADVQQELDSIGVPFVLVDRIFENIQTNQVSYDNEYGGYLATQYLIEQGCKHIACFTGSLLTYGGRQRYEGHLRALEESGYPITKANRYEGDYRYETGYVFGKDVVARKDIDGVFACNDLMAYGLLKAMDDVGLTQKTLKVVGYDNLKQSEMFGIPLTSVSQDLSVLAMHASKHLLKQIEDQSYQEDTVLKPELVK
ncbi:LacI family DNA-binding transcriptional regulator [Erysipelothrix rhusiopathiae]|uniref:LacI family DNA-binding transcriptional regulator n=1 Tax=Erysipelothrix rhusiopathiae TaxID=1648 RepID=UPI002B2533BD|nr:LacI family DNA-binding transcriptional regulator [Erysipelothrix rhusiopathiae]WRB93556.1 LacI family DNA-binding transcriptional regulator [Erysipelothrix rhusiopathiae]